MSYSHGSHHIRCYSWYVLLFVDSDILILGAGGRFAVKHVPLNLRQILSAESAANDGLGRSYHNVTSLYWFDWFLSAYPFLSVSIYLTVETSRRVAIGKWFVVGWLCGYPYFHLCCRTDLLITDEVVLGVVLGAVLGRTFAWLMRISLRKGFIDRQSYVAQYLAMAFFTIGIASTIGSDDLLAAFAAGRAVFILASSSY